MTRAAAYAHEFVEFVPEELADGVVYVSIEYATSAHKCMCGCGSKIVTPLAPNRWALMFDGETVSLEPSIGNWSYQCQSHYWLHRGRVEWARQWTHAEIQTARQLGPMKNPSLAHQLQRQPWRRTSQLGQRTLPTSAANPAASIAEPLSASTYDSLVEVARTPRAPCGYSPKELRYSALMSLNRRLDLGRSMRIVELAGGLGPQPSDNKDTVARHASASCRRSGTLSGKVGTTLACLERSPRC